MDWFRRQQTATAGVCAGPSIINEKLGLQEYRVIEEGLCGRTTVFDDPFREGRRGTQLFPTLLETHRLLDCIVIMLGTNDCKTVYGASAGVIAKVLKN